MPQKKDTPAFTWATAAGRAAWLTLEAYNDVTRAVGRDRGVLVVDLAKRVPKSTCLFYDSGRFTAAGAERVGAVVAEALAPRLQENVK